MLPNQENQCGYGRMIHAHIFKGLMIVILLMFAFSYMKYVNSYDKSIEPSSFRSFSVSATGEVVAVPDIAQFTYQVITEGGIDVADLQQENTKKMNTINEFVKDEGVKEKDIKTQSYNVSPRYEYFRCDGEGSCPPPEIVGYSIRQSVMIKVRDFDSVGALLGGVVEKGANSVSQLTFTIDDEDEVKNEAREEAMEKAKEKAEAIADAGDFKVGRLLSVSESSGYMPEPYYDYAYGLGGVSMEEKSMPSIEPGSQEMTVTMTLTYEIE